MKIKLTNTAASAGWNGRLITTNHLPFITTYIRSEQRFDDTAYMYKGLAL